MRVSLALHQPAARAATIGAVIGICGWLLYMAVCDFLVSALTDERILVSADAAPGSFVTAPFTDERVGVNPDVLARVARYFPNSPRLYLRLAEFETYQGNDDGWRAAQSHAMRTIRISPHDYRPRLLLAAIQEYQEDLQGAEESVRAALELAPGNLEGHWQLGALRLNRGNLNGSLEEFRVAASGHDAYFREALKLIWPTSDENVDAVRAITPDNPKARLGLARFLLDQSRPLESAAVFRQIDRDALLADKESSHYLDSLIAARHFTLARDLWSGLLDRGGEAPEGTPNAIWNPGFESDILLDFAQFDWSIRPSNYAQISIDSRTAHSGKRSLRVDFIGLETTKLEDEIQQRALVRPRARCPRIVVSGAASDPAPAGSADWRQRTVEFTASAPDLIVAIQQRPRFSYENPTHGTIWLDDFELREIQ